MATARKPTRPIGSAPVESEAVNDPDDVELPEGVSELAASPLGAVMSLLGGGGSVNVVVYREVRGEKPRYLFACPGESFTVDRLRDEYNGGEFRLFISVNGQLKRNVVVAVEAPAEKARDPGIGGSADLVVAMREGFAAQSQLLRDVLMSMRHSAPPAPPPPDLPALMESMAKMMASMRPEPAPGVAPAPVAPATDLIKVLLQGVELGKGFVPGASDEGGGLSGLVKKVLDSPLAAAAASAVMTQAASPPPAPAPVAPRVQAVRGPDVPSPSPVPQPQGQNAMMARYVAQLVKWAEMEADPDVYAVMIVDNVPEAMLRRIIEAPDALDQMAAVNPGVNTYRPWFEALRERVITHLNDGADPDPLAGTNSDSTASGVGANVAGDVHGHVTEDIPRDAA